MFGQRTLVSETITTALTGVVRGSGGGFYAAKGLIVEARFVYGSGGTTVKAYLQTSLDGGVNWMDFMAFAFATASARKVMAIQRAAIAAAVTPGDAVLTDDTAINVLGEHIRAKLTTVGTYAGGTQLIINITPVG